jgi:anaerobic selenocysteine-containing dehydrogenase
MKGRDRCTQLMHTADAPQRGGRTGDVVEVVSPTGKLQVPRGR